MADPSAFDPVTGSHTTGNVRGVIVADSSTGTASHAYGVWAVTAP